MVGLYITCASAVLPVGRPWLWLRMNNSRRDGKRDHRHEMFPYLDRKLIT